MKRGRELERMKREKERVWGKNESACLVSRTGPAAALAWRLASKVFQVLSCLEDCRKEASWPGLGWYAAGRQGGLALGRERKTLHFTTIFGTAKRGRRKKR